MERKQENFKTRQGVRKFKEYEASTDDRIRVGLVGTGYHGDVWPLVTLAQALGKRGYAVRLFVPENMLHLCTECGVSGVATFNDTKEGVERAGGHDNSMKARLNLSMALGDWVEERHSACGVVDALNIYKPQLVIVGNIWSQPAINYEKESRIPVIPIFFNRWQMNVALAKWFLEPPRPLIYAMSDILDTGELCSHAVQRVGPLGQMPRRDVADLSVELQDFLAQGPAPVAAGFGSMMPRSPLPSQLLCMILRALKTNGKRGVVLGGWQRLDSLGQELVLKGTLPGLSSEDADLADFARQQVFFAEHVPHASLLPACCCFIHHGGAGTTQTAMRAGCPQIVVPVCRDQVQHAELVAEAGVGLDLKLLSSHSARGLVEAVGSVASLRDAALYVASVMAGERGEGEVCEIIDRFVKEKLPPAKVAPKVFDDVFAFEKACSPQPRFNRKENCVDGGVAKECDASSRRGWKGKQLQQGSSPMSTTIRVQ